MSHPAEKKKRKKNSHEIIAKTSSHRSSHVIDEPCSAAVCETLHVLRWFTASCCVLSLSAHALGAAFFLGCALVPHSECPGRCSTELPPRTAGRLCSHCNQSEHACVCGQLCVHACYSAQPRLVAALARPTVVLEPPDLSHQPVFATTRRIFQDYESDIPLDKKKPIKEVFNLEETEKLKRNVPTISTCAS